jgi:hypothetical protein
MRVLALEVVTPTWVTMPRVVDKGDRLSWKGLVEQMEEELLVIRGQRRRTKQPQHGAWRSVPLVYASWRMLGGGKCIGEYWNAMWNAMAPKWWEGRDDWKGSLVEVKPSPKEGWLNGMRGVRYEKHQSNPQWREVWAWKTTPVSWGGASIYAGYKEREEELNGKLGAGTPVEVAKWPEVSVIWKTKKVPRRDIFLDTVTPEAKALVLGEMRAGREDRIEVTRLSWEILGKVPEVMREEGFYGVWGKEEKRDGKA